MISGKGSPLWVRAFSLDGPGTKVPGRVRDPALEFGRFAIRTRPSDLPCDWLCPGGSDSLITIHDFRPGNYMWRENPYQGFTGRVL